MPRRATRLLLTPAAVIMVAGAVILAGAAAALALRAPSTDELLIAGLSVLLLAPLVVRGLQRRFDPFEPIVLFSLVYASMFVVRPIAILASGNYESADQYRSYFNFYEGFQSMLVLAVVGAIAFVIGYAVPAGRSLARLAPVPPDRYSGDVASLIAAGFGLVGIAFFVVFLVFSGGANAVRVFLAGRSIELTQLLVQSNKYLIFAPVLLLPAAVMLFALSTAERRPLGLAAAAASALGLFFIAAPTGSRSLLFPLVISIVLYHYLSHDRRPRFTFVVLSILLALFLSAFIASARTANVRQTVGVSETFSRLLHQPARVFDPLVKGQDAAEADMVAGVLSLPPNDIPSTNGRGVIGDLLTRAVPRSLWANKPDPPRQVITRKLFGQLADTGAANPEFSAVLYPYLDAGLVGVLILMTCYGFVARALFEWTTMHRTNIVVRLTFALALPPLVAGLRDSPVDTFARVAFILIPLAITFWIARLASLGSSRRTARRHASSAAS